MRPIIQWCWYGSSHIWVICWDQIWACQSLQAHPNSNPMTMWLLHLPPLWSVHSILIWERELSITTSRRRQWDQSLRPPGSCLDLPVTSLFFIRYMDKSLIHTPHTSPQAQLLIHWGQGLYPLPHRNTPINPLGQNWLGLGSVCSLSVSFTMISHTLALTCMQISKKSLSWRGIIKDFKNLGS